MTQKNIEIMDSTLRDGEQTSGVSFVPHEKLMVARMLLRDVNVDRIEVASARVSEGEKEAVRMICRYAQMAGMAFLFALLLFAFLLFLGILSFSPGLSLSGSLSCGFAFFSWSVPNP